MKKSETEDSNDDVFYSLSSAVSVTASDVTRTPSPSPTGQTGLASSSSAENKGKGLGSRLKAFRPRKLIPKRFKTASNEVSPEVLMPKSDDNETPTPEKGKKESKIPKRTRASQIVRRLTFKKGQKVAPKGVEIDDDTSTTSSSTTPMSMKRETPEGATLSVSDQSLCPVEERSVEESSADQSERKSSSASNQSASKQELKITISGKKIEKLKRLYEIKGDDNNDTKDRSFEQSLKYDVSAIVKDTNMASLSSTSSSDKKTSSNAVMKTKNNKKSTTIAPVVLLPSPPPTPQMSIHIPLKYDTPKPISTISTKRDQVPTTTARLVSNENKNIVTDRDEPLLRQELVELSDKNITSNINNKKESLKSKLINKLNINRSVHDITPTVVAPVVPYKLSEQEISKIISSHAQKPLNALTPEEYTEFIKQDRDKSFSEQTTEKIFTLSEHNEASMKRSEDSDTQNKTTSKQKKRTKKSTTESSDSGLSTSVHVQEPQQPYQKQLSTSKSGDLNDPDNLLLNPSPKEEDEVTINKSGEISFRIGTPVRPPATTTNLSNITHITESISIDSTNDNNKSLEEISSISSESQSPPTSESSRKKIKYLPQPTLYSSEEQALLEGNFGPPSFVASEYSIDYSLNPLSMATEGAEGTNPTAQAGLTNLTMSSEKREHLYKILVIGELGTGKTSFIKRYVHQFFSQNYRATIGVDFALKVLNWDANTIIRLQLWDIAGQERFGNMTRVYYKEAVGAFIVFDATKTSTFDAVIKWKQDLDSKVQLPDGSSIPCILLANKCDQPKQGIVTTPAKLDEYCKENGFSGWFETSAKENINIDDAAKALVNKILANDKVMNSNEGEMDGFAIDGRDNGTSKKNCAC